MNIREKVILKDFTVLLVCPSLKWSTLERRVLFDSVFLRNLGCNPVVLCVKGSQIDIEMEAEDISRVYLNNKINYYFGAPFLLELRKLILENRFDLIHCYSLSSTWFSAIVLGTRHEVPLFLTYNQNFSNAPSSIFAKWLLRRVDYIFTLSGEVEDFVKENFPIPAKKVRTLGVGVEVNTKKISLKNKKTTKIGCVVDSLSGGNDLHFPIKAFRLLKNSSEGIWDSIELNLFLGPKIYESEKGKEALAELDHEFYKGDLHLIHKRGNLAKIKELDIFFGTAFNEPVNDYEIAALLHGVPVLFPRTAMRQSILHVYTGVGESYFQDDHREVRVKLLKMLSDLTGYRKNLKKVISDISLNHGLDFYADEFQKFYEMAYLKRLRIKHKKSRKG